MRKVANKLLAATIATAIALSAAPAAGDVSSAQVQKAIQRGVARLRSQQGFDGRWAYSSNSDGCTALCLLAMLNAGVNPDDPQIAKGLAALNGSINERTYDVALKCQVYSAIIQSQTAAPPGMAARLQEAADFLTGAQLPSGMWTYTSGKTEGGDNSNTQFALLGLHEAAKAGATVPREMWIRARGHLLASQSNEGGWGYTPNQRAYGSMTAAGLAGLFISGQQQHVTRAKAFHNGEYLYCGRYRRDKAITAGLLWLVRNFSVRGNPRKGSQWLYYYLYALERVGMLSGQQDIGPHDWYREGAAFLVADQHASGAWGASTYETALGVLFLAKGNRPVLFQKLKWNGLWNRNVHDLEHLAAFIGTKFGKPTSWQNADLNQPLRQLRQAPILYITGHQCPRLNEPQKEKIRQYIAAGGTVLAEACCGKQEFIDGFRTLAAELYEDYPLRPLPADHAVFSSYYKLTDTYGLEGIDAGCRTVVFFSPKALSALWELETIPELSEQAFKLGTNIAAYATGREVLGDRLDVPALSAPRRDEEEKPQAAPPRSTVRLARLVHGGDYNADPRAMVHLAEILRDEARVDVIAQARHLRATDEELFDYPVLFMTGHNHFMLSDEEVAALRTYLQRGGVLMADACCGRKEFDESFRALMATMFPDQPFTPLTTDHPIYTGQVGAPLGELRYRMLLAEELGERGMAVPPATPQDGPLEGIVLEGRTAVIYSRYDYSCGLEGDSPLSARGYVDEDARRLAANIVLFAVAY